MKLFLMVYPIEVYLTAIKDNFLDQSDWDQVMDRFNELINLRYREKGFTIVHVVPTLDGETEALEFAREIDMQPGDVKLLNLVRGHYVRNFHKGYLLSDLYAIVRDNPVEESVVGGFHRRKCVTAMADFLDSLGLDASIDPDLTEEFFRHWRQIPDEREYLLKREMIQDEVQIS